MACGKAVLAAENQYVRAKVWALVTSPDPVTHTNTNTNTNTKKEEKTNIQNKRRVYSGNKQMNQKNHLMMIMMIIMICIMIYTMIYIMIYDSHDDTHNNNNKNKKNNIVVSNN